MKHVLFNNSVFVLSLNPISEGDPKIKVWFFILHICTFVGGGGELLKYQYIYSDILILYVYGRLVDGIILYVTFVDGFAKSVMMHALLKPDFSYESFIII